MEGGSKYFNGEIPFIMSLRGEINGQTFGIEGKGVGVTAEGYSKGKWICTTGELPISWTAIAFTLGYGSKVFVKYPNGIVHFCQECFPSGYSQERSVEFKDDGIFKVFHEVKMNKGVLFNKVTMQGSGFKADSPVLNKGLKGMLPYTEATYPFENGMRCVAHYVYPLKDESGYATAEMITVIRPLGDGDVKQPGYHNTRGDILQSKDIDDDSHHVIQEEKMEAYEQNLFKQ